MNSLRNEGRVLSEAVWAAGQVVLRQQPLPFAVQTHGEVKEFANLRSMATAADRESEENMLRYVEDCLGPVVRFGEETGLSNDDAQFRLVLDGIDGTGHYCHGCDSLWAVMAALEQNGEILYGAMAFPGTGEQLVGSKPDEACWYNRKPGPGMNWQPITLNADERPSSLRDAQWAFWRGKTRHARVLLQPPYCHLFEASDSECLNVVSTAGATMMLLKGNLDVLIIPRQAYWDAAPAHAIINAAGGRCGLFSSPNWRMSVTPEGIRRAGLDYQPNFLAAATSELYDKTLAILQSR